jgi:uncharacterized protein (TIGR03067 family)
MKLRAVVLAGVALVAGAGLLVAAGDAKEEAVKKDLEALKGVWKVVSVEKDGKKLGEEQLKGVSVRFDASGKASGHKGDKVIFEATFRIDPTKEPRTIDATQTSEGEGKGKTNPGIYEIKGDTLRTCISETGKDRPTEFSAGPGSGRTLRVYEREKR